MTLRQKTFIALVISFVCLFGVLHVLFDQILTRHLVQLERIETQEHIIRVRHSLRQELVHLDRAVQDWAQWDDSYQFLQDKNQAYQDANLNDSGLSPARINLLLFIRPTGEVVVGTEYDVANSVKKPLSASMKSLV